MDFQPHPYWEWPLPPMNENRCRWAAHMLYELCRSTERTTMSEADDYISEWLMTLSRDPKYADIAEQLAEASIHVHDLNAIIDMEVPRWRPIETAPLGTPMWVFHDRRTMMAMLVHGNKGPKWVACGYCERSASSVWSIGDANNADINPTLWHPLPEPPKERRDA